MVKAGKLYHIFAAFLINNNNNDWLWTKYAQGVEELFNNGSPRSSPAHTLYLTCCPSLYIFRLSTRFLDLLLKLRFNSSILQ